MARETAAKKPSRAVTTITVEPRRPYHPGYSPEIGQKICDAMVEEGSLKDACRRYWSEFPDYVTILQWVTRHPEFESLYVRARERLMERWSEDIVEIAYDKTMEPNERRVIIDTKKWLMSKLAHRRYGDKIQVSGDPDNPIQVLHKTVALDALSAAELDALDAFTSARLAATDVETEEVVDNAGVSPDAQG